MADGTLSAGQVSLSVKPDSKDFGKKLAGDIKGQDNQFSDIGKRIGTTIATGLGKASLVAGAAAGVGVAAIVTAGVKYNAAIENFDAGFTTLLGSADKAKGLLNQLSSFAAATPFEMPQLADASQTILSFGEDANNLMPDLKMLGDISLGNSEKMSGLALVFGQVQSQGKLMGQDLLQMINNGFNPLQVISQTTGESMASLKDKMTKGQISFDQVRQAMVDATSAGGQFYQAMDNGSKTLTGQWSTLTDGVNILSGAMVNSLSASLTMAVIPSLNAVVGGLTDMMNGVDGADQEVRNAAASMAKAIATQLGPAIGDMVEAFSVAFTALGPTFGEIITTLVQSLAKVLPSIMTLAGSLIVALIEGITAALPLLASQAVPILLSLVMAILGQMPAILQAAFQVIAELGRGLIAALPTLVPQVVAIVVQLVQTIIANLPLILSVALSLITSLAQGIITAIPVLIAALPSIITGLINFLLGAIPMIMQTGLQLLTSIIGALPQIIGAVVTAIPQIINAIVGFLSGGGVNMIISGGIALFLGLVDALTKSLPEIVGAVIGAIPQIVRALIGAIPQLIDAGRQLIGGLTSGLLDAIPRIFDDVKGALGGMVDKVKGFFGIKSPSTLFRDEVGAMLGEGMAVGLVKSTGSVTSAAAGLARSAQIAASGRMTAGMDLASSMNANGDKAGNAAPVRLHPDDLDYLAARVGVSTASGAQTIATSNLAGAARTDDNTRTTQGRKW